MEPSHQPTSAHHTEPADALAASAARWVTRRDAGLNAGERDQLRAWLATDARHAAAFARADARGTELDWPLHAGTVDHVLAGLESRATRRRVRRQAMIATSVAAVLIIAFGIFSRRGGETPAPLAASLPTMVVKAPQRQILPDGTIVDLKDGAQISIHFSDEARRVTLSEGTAHFQVTKSTVPFIVTAAGITANVLGTAFSVELDAKKVSVLVTEGLVAVNKENAAPASLAPAAAPVAPSEPLALLDAGKTISVSIAADARSLASPVAVVSADEVEDRLSWRIPRLEFTATSLADVVAMVNRHNRVQMVIADSSLEKLTLSGVLRADKVDALVAMLEVDFHVKTERRDGQIILQTKSH